jgi:hypothetical protein
MRLKGRPKGSKDRLKRRSGITLIDRFEANVFYGVC